LCGLEGPAFSPDGLYTVIRDGAKVWRVEIRGTSGDSSAHPVIIGDSDIVRPEHVVEMFRLLGGGVPGDVSGLPRSQLAILPGTTHVTVVDRPADIVRVLVYTGLKFNFYDVLVMAIDDQVLREQVEKARQRLGHDSSVMRLSSSSRNVMHSLSRP